MKKITFLSFVVLFLSVSAFGSTNPGSGSTEIEFPAERYVLENGLTVILAPDHSSPIYSMQIWFRVGARYESMGATGSTHFLEHFLFKGSKKYPEGMFEQLIQANGGSFNAATSKDFTYYYVNMPSGTLDLVASIEADRMKNLLWEEKKFEKEKKVIMEERRMTTDNSEFGLLYESLWSGAFKRHPYGWPIIGWMKDIESMKQVDLKKHYERYYSPNNAVLVLAGDFEKEKAFGTIKKHFGPLPKSEIPKLEIQKEPIQKGERNKTLKRDFSSESVLMGYHICESGNEMQYPLDLLNTVLFEGDSGRLVSQLVYNKAISTNVSGSPYTPKDPGLYYIYIKMKPGMSALTARKTVLAEIAKIRNSGITERELQKAKNRVMTDMVFGLKTVSGKASMLGISEIYGDYRSFFNDMEKYRQVTVEDVKKAAAKYLVRQNLTTIRIVPTSKKKK